MAKSKTSRRDRIKRSIRKNVFGTAARPRLTVFRSNAQIYAQLIDDNAGTTLVSCGSLKNDAAQKVSKIEQAKLVGSEIAEKALSAGISEVVFDRNGYLYHGRVKTLADSAREAGLKL